ncbi:MULTISPECIES: LysR family transcriptional regulator [Pontibacillus]|uniref:LysR family transcriptional regulator n=1 Tax=Pontibacillus chungwhensis TaxID=265426 RepID=A0ABY8V4Q0_9BACI|nr:MULTISPECIES: LysR family transcriptional regulator [Pontibacillus]MCD5322272.1 LysR family transcriptional regulator [Pontibacillus sp. HN14]WIF99564.1 LysR family transcriptional regulator [Pontibacillus chungwhensis]
MDLNYIETFHEVAKTGSYTKTGEVLGYAQSSVTTHIKKLEDHYGVKLFERVGQRMRLTTSGEELLHYTKQVTDLLDEAKMRLSEETSVRGTIRIGTVESLAAYFITPYIKSLKTRHPDLIIQLEAGLCPNLKQGTVEANFDVAILLDRYINHPSLTTIPIREEELVVIAPPGHALAEEEVDLEALGKETLILTEQGCSYRTLLEDLLREEGVEIGPVISFTSLEAIKQCVADGLGIALLPRITIEQELKDQKLISLPFHHEKLTLWTQLVYQKKKWITPPIKELLSLITEEAG